jgi:glycosyltransferase involved in cell wall biosynthesis
MTHIRLLAVIEAETITGPAKNLLEFIKTVREPTFGIPVDVAIATFVRQGRANNAFVQIAAAAGIPVFPIAETGRFDRSTLGALRGVADQFRPNLIQTHAVKSHFLLRLTGLYRSIPWIAFHHGYTWPDLRVRMYNELDRWSLRAASQAITVSLPFREQLIHRGVDQRRIEVIHNAIDPMWGRRIDPGTAAEVRHSLNIDPQQKVIVIVGRLSAEKDHLTLLHAFAQVSEACKEQRPHLLIVGDGPERHGIEAAIRQLGLADKITLAGQQKSAEPFYAISSVAVLSSLSEGSPNALLEAMAAGIPAVATRVGGIPEIARDRENAMLVAPRDLTQMAASITTLLRDSKLAQKMADSAYQTILSNHAPAARAHRLCGVYQKVLGIPEM